jgi:hypothetical protein
MENKSFLFINISLELRDKVTKLVKSNKGRMAKNINDNLDFLVLGEDKMDPYLKKVIYLPAKEISSIQIIKYAEFEAMVQKKKAENPSKGKTQSKEKVIKKSELFQFLWDSVGSYIFDYKYEIKVSKREAEYLEEKGLGHITRNISSSESLIKIKAEDFVDLNFKEDFADFFNTDSLKGDKNYKAVELEKWINKSFSELHSFFCGFTVLGGDIFFAEHGDNPWENPKTIYLELPSKLFTLSDINKGWSDERFYLEDEEFDSFVDEILV